MRQAGLEEGKSDTAAATASFASPPLPLSLFQGFLVPLPQRADSCSQRQSLNGLLVCAAVIHLEGTSSFIWALSWSQGGRLPPSIPGRGRLGSWIRGSLSLLPLHFVAFLSSSELRSWKIRIIQSLCEQVSKSPTPPQPQK